MGGAGAVDELARQTRGSCLLPPDSAQTAVFPRPLPPLRLTFQTHDYAASSSLFVLCITVKSSQSAYF